MSGEQVFTLANWSGQRPLVDDWMEGRPTVLRYVQPDMRPATIDVITVFRRPSAAMSDIEGIMLTSLDDARSAAVTAAADIALRAAGGHARRAQIREMLADPARHVEWRAATVVVGGSFLEVQTGNVLAVAFAAYGERPEAYLAIASTTPLDGLSLVNAPATNLRP